MKTADDAPLPKQKSQTTSAKKKPRVDTGVAGGGGHALEKSFDLSQSLFPPAPSTAVRHSTASASAASARDDSKTVSWC